MVSVVAYREEEAEHAVIVKAISGAIQISSASVSLRKRVKNYTFQLYKILAMFKWNVLSWILLLLHSMYQNFIFLFCCERLAFVLIVGWFLFQLVNVIQPDRPHYIVNAILGNVSAYQESVATSVTAAQEEQRDKYLTVSRVASALIIGIVSLRSSKVCLTCTLRPTFVRSSKDDVGPMKYQTKLWNCTLNFRWNWVSSERRRKHKGWRSTRRLWRRVPWNGRETWRGASYSRWS